MCFILVFPDNSMWLQFSSAMHTEAGQGVGFPLEPGWFWHQTPCLNGWNTFVELTKVERNLAGLLALMDFKLTVLQGWTKHRWQFVFSQRCVRSFLFSGSFSLGVGLVLFFNKQLKKENQLIYLNCPIDYHP